MDKHWKDRWVDRLWSFGFSLLGGVFVSVAAFFYLRSSILAIVTKTAQTLKIDAIVAQLDSLPKAMRSTTQSSISAGKSSVQFATYRKEAQELELGLREAIEDFKQLLVSFDALEVKQPGRYEGVINANPKKAVRGQLEVLRDVLLGLQADVGKLHSQIDVMEQLEVSERQRLLDQMKAELAQVIRFYESSYLTIAREIQQVRDKLVDRKEVMVEVLKNWGEGQ